MCHINTNQVGQINENINGIDFAINEKKKKKKKKEDGFGCKMSLKCTISCECHSFMRP
jgi:hypothetical protein